MVEGQYSKFRDMKSSYWALRYGIIVYCFNIIIILLSLFLHKIIILALSLLIFPVIISELSYRYFVKSRCSKKIIYKEGFKLFTLWIIGSISVMILSNFLLIRYFPGMNFILISKIVVFQTLLSATGIFLSIRSSFKIRNYRILNMERSGIPYSKLVFQN